MANRTQLIVDDLHPEVKLFLDKALGRYPTVTTQTGSIYVGELVGQKQHGIGFCQTPDKSYYFGYWLDGKRHGKGTSVQKNGTVYQGEWQFDKMNGWGTLKNSNGTVYEGEWKNHQPHG